jgi:hypothetical protein
VLEGAGLRKDMAEEEEGEPSEVYELDFSGFEDEEVADEAYLGEATLAKLRSGSLDFDDEDEEIVEEEEIVQEEEIVEDEEIAESLLEDEEPEEEIDEEPEEEPDEESEEEPDEEPDEEPEEEPDEESDEEPQEEPDEDEDD